MAWRRNNYGQAEALDGSLGLIMRIAVLWTKVDTAASDGNFERWNAYLDCIWRNLSYREELYSIEKDGKVVNVTLSPKDRELWKKLNSKLIIAKNNLSAALKKKSKEEYLKAKDEYYKAMWLKDVGLRKFQHNTLGNYIKEISKNPSKSMWGG
jgi:hypothetical protein